jgi:hypothetical protein
MPANLRKILVAASVMCAAPSAFANVITDWDEKAIVAVTPMASLGGTSPYMAQRMMARSRPPCSTRSIPSNGRRIPCVSDYV